MLAGDPVSGGLTMNSIIIPHRDRHENLRQCVRSVEWSDARLAGLAVTVPAWEVLIVDNGSENRHAAEPFDVPARVRVIADERPMPIFAKCAMLNRGIAEARGEVLTFLDADAVVGPLWLAGIVALDDPAVTLLAYRVRYLPPRTRIAGEAQWLALFDEGVYARAPRAYEAYGEVRNNPKVAPADPAGSVIGNSQFSIRREALGGLRWDERYVGRGWEDLDMLRRIVEHFGPRYRGAIRTEAAFSLYHVKNEYRGDWKTPATTTANRRRFKGLDPCPKEAT